MARDGVLVGIDIGKQKHAVAITDTRRSGQPKTFFMSNTREGFGKLSDALERYDAPVAVVVEATGHYWRPLHQFLTGRAVPVEVIQPLQALQWTKVGLRKTKTDAHDAKALLELAIDQPKQVKPSYVPDAQLAEMRELVRLRVQLVQQLATAKTRVLSMLDQSFPEFTAHFSDPFGVTARAVLRKAASAVSFRRLKVGALRTLITKKSRGQIAADQADALYASAQTSIGLTSVWSMLEGKIHVYLDQIQLFEKQIAGVDAQLAHWEDEDPSYLATIPGISVTMAGILRAEIGAITRFATKHNLVAYAGIDIEKNESGNHVGTRRHLNKHGNAALRTSLYQATCQVVLHDPQLKAYYERRRAQGDAYTEAIIATARKLLYRIFLILREKRPYEVRPPVGPASVTPDAGRTTPPALARSSRRTAKRTTRPRTVARPPRAQRPLAPPIANGEPPASGAEMGLGAGERRGRKAVPRTTAAGRLEQERAEPTHEGVPPSSQPTVGMGAGRRAVPIPTAVPSEHERLNPTRKTPHTP